LTVSKRSVIDKTGEWPAVITVLWIFCNVMHCTSHIRPSVRQNKVREPLSHKVQIW